LGGHSLSQGGVFRQWQVLWRSPFSQRLASLRSGYWPLPDTALDEEAALRPVWKRKFIHTTDSRHDLPVAENLLNRHFEADAPNQVWGSDISYVRTRQDWLYLATVMDLFSRKIVGGRWRQRCQPNW
jgi:transposase InsO family protein